MIERDMLEPAARPAGGTQEGGRVRRLGEVLGACLAAFTIGLLAGELHGAERVRQAERDALQAIVQQLGTDLLITHEALKIAADPTTRAMAGAQAVRNVLERQKIEAPKKATPP